MVSDAFLISPSVYVETQIGAKKAMHEDWTMAACAGGFGSAARNPAQSPGGCRVAASVAVR